MMTDQELIKKHEEMHLYLIKSRNPPASGSFKIAQDYFLNTITDKISCKKCNGRGILDFGFYTRQCECRLRNIDSSNSDDNDIENQS